MILKTDRPTNTTDVIKVLPETPKTEDPKPEMKPTDGGAGVITQKQLITTLIVIVVIAVIIVVGVYLYKRYQKSPLTVQ